MPVPFVEEVALRCLGRDDELAAALVHIESRDERSKSAIRARDTLVSWLRGGDIDLRRTLAATPATTALVAHGAPLLAMALRSCEERSR